MRHDCDECARLWREYGEATTAHIRITGKLQVAALRKDIENIAVITPMLERAEAARSEARLAIRNHESIAHPNAEAAQAE